MPSSCSCDPSLCNSEQLVILVVDDETDFAAATASFLSTHGLSAHCAYNLHQAKEFLKNHKVDLVLSDLRLSDAKLGGLDLLESNPSRTYPFILMTAWGDYEIARRGLNSGADYLLEKPFSLDGLHGLIFDIYKKSKKYHESEHETLLGKLRLTTRETAIVKLILKGLSNREIAHSLGNSEKTIKTHITSIFRKAGVANRSAFLCQYLPLQKV